MGIPAFNGLPAPVLKHEMLASYSIDYPAIGATAAGMVERLFKGEKVASIKPTVPTPAEHQVIISQQQLDKFKIKPPRSLRQMRHMPGEVSNNAAPALKIAGVSKVFNRGTSTERRALNGVNLTLSEGDFAVVIGSNGAGKSTLLGVIAGDVIPDAGTVSIGATDVTGMPVHRRASLVARVFQDPSRGTAPGLTVEENLAIAYRRGFRRYLNTAVTPSRRKIFQEALAPLGLGLERRPRYARRSAVRRAAASLVAYHGVPDETFDSGAGRALCRARPRTAEAVMNATFNAVQASRITTLMVTHNMHHAIGHGNRLNMMDEGAVAFEAQGAEKEGLTVPSLVSRFQTADDKLLLVR